MDKHKTDINEYITNIHEFIDNCEIDLSIVHSLSEFALIFDDKQIDEITKITEIIQNDIIDNPLMIVKYLKNNVDNYK